MEGRADLAWMHCLVEHSLAKPRKASAREGEREREVKKYIYIYLLYI